MFYCDVDLNHGDGREYFNLHVKNNLDLKN